MTDLLAQLGVKTSGDVVARSPIDGVEIGRVTYSDAAFVEKTIAASVEAFRAWRDVPAPKRGELVRLFGEELRANKDALGRLVTLEAGKILQEGLGDPFGPHRVAREEDALGDVARLCADVHAHLFVPFSLGGCADLARVPGPGAGRRRASSYLLHGGVSERPKEHASKACDG